MIKALFSSLIKNKIVFISVCISILVSTWCTLYSYGILSTTLTEYEKYTSEIRSYTAYLTDNPVEFTETISLKYIKSVGDILVDDIVFYIVGEDRLVTSANGLPNHVQLGKKLNPLNNNEIVIGLKSTNDYYKIGSEYTLFSKIYNVVGIRETADYSEININSLKNTALIEEINIILKNVPNKKDELVMMDYLNKILPNSLIKEPVAFEKAKIVTNNFHFLVSLLILVISIIFLSFVYKFLLISRQKLYAIFRMYGCNKLKGIIIFYTELLMLLTFNFLIGLFLYKTVIEKLIVIENIYNVSSLNLYYIIISLLQMYLLSIVIFAPGIINFSSMSPISLTKMKRGNR